MARRKGVSPLIAAVLLIAFTMAIAAILTAWVTSFTKQKQEEIRIFEEKMKCVGANILLRQDFTYWDESNKTMHTLIENIGSEDVKVANVIVEFENLRLPVFIKHNSPIIPKGKKMYFDINVTDTEDGTPVNLTEAGDVESIKVETTCEGVYSKINKPINGWYTK